MANLTINLPRQTGEAAHDFNELYSWANRLVSELRTLIHTLDSSNIRSLSADKLTGSIDAARLTGTAAQLFTGSGGLLLTDEDTGSEARIYMNGNKLNIEAEHVYINGTEVEDNV